MSTTDYKILMMTSDPCLTGARRRRDSGATARDILQAAAELFATHGYEGAGTREIAARAGVNVALISRYFGSKAGLFEAAVLPMLSIDGLIAGDMAQFGARVAAYYLGPLPAKTADPILAAMRSAGSDEVAQALRAAITRQLIDPLAARLSGPDASSRASRIIMLIAGVDVTVRIMKVLPRVDEDRAAIRDGLAKSIQDLVDG